MCVDFTIYYNEIYLKYFNFGEILIYIVTQAIKGNIGNILKGNLLKGNRSERL